MGGKYASYEHSEDFKNEDCGAYCYHNGVNCKAYAISGTTCYVLNLLTYSDTDVADSLSVYYNEGKGKF